MSSWHLPLMLVWLHCCYYGYIAGVVCCYGYPAAVMAQGSCNPGRETERRARYCKMIDCLVEDKDSALKSENTKFDFKLMENFCLIF